MNLSFVDFSFIPTFIFFGRRVSNLFGEANAHILGDIKA